MNSAMKEHLLPPQNEVAVPFEDGQFIIRWDNEAYRNRLFEGLSFIPQDVLSRTVLPIRDELSIHMGNIDNANLGNESRLKRVLERIPLTKSDKIGYSNGIGIWVDPEVTLNLYKETVETLPNEELRVAAAKQLIDATIRHEAQHVRQNIRDAVYGVDATAEDDILQKKSRIQVLAGVGLYAGVGSLVAAIGSSLAERMTSANYQLDLSIKLLAIGLPLAGMSLLVTEINEKKNYLQTESEKEVREQQKPEYFINSPLDIQFIKT